MADAPFRKTLAQIVDDSYENSAAHGFWDTPETDETTPSKLALIHSEVSEALESYRNPDSDHLVPVPEELLLRILDNQDGTQTSDPVAQLRAFNDALSDLSVLYDKWDAKPKGLDIEMADIVIRVADFCGKHGIDLDEAVQRKHAYNVTRPHRHGRIV